MKTTDLNRIARGCAGASYAAIILSIASATIVEARLGSELAQAYVYHAPWFWALWALALISAAFMLKRAKASPPAMMLHGAFALILLGGLLTFCTSKKGVVHLREGSYSDYFMAPGGTREPFGFALALDSFKIERHPGTESPADYVTFFRSAAEDGETLSHRVSMNSIASVGGYRLYQSSYDPDLRGSYLSVNYDPWGIALTYCGYALALLGFAGIMLYPRGRFRSLLKSSSLSKLGLMLLPLMLLTTESAGAVPVLSRASADSLSALPVMYQGRIAPFNTPARDFTVKLYGKDSYNGLTAEQVMASFILYPGEWSAEKILRVKTRALADSLGIEGRYASWQDLYDGTDYKLQKYLARPSSDLDFDKDAKALDQKQTLLIMLGRNALFNPKLSPEALAEADEDKLRAEVFYNGLGLNSIMFKANMAVGLAALLYFLFCMFSPKRIPGAGIFLYCYNAASFALLLFYQLLRAYVSGHVPLSNGFECMVSAALLANAAGLIAPRAGLLPRAGAILVSGAALMVSSFSSSDPAISHLMPVLNSPWLSAHVSCMILSYSLCGMTAVNSIAALISLAFGGREHAADIARLNGIILYPAVFFMAAGIFLGAVWANVSWGRYWAWDPKESWALISLLLYALPLHGWFNAAFKNKAWLHIYYLLCICSIAMTYFGVNNLLGGMHAYN